MTIEVFPCHPLEAAPTAPMVSALETRSPAYPSHLPMYPHHMPSRVTRRHSETAADAACVFSSSHVCHERPPDVPVRSGRCKDAAERARRHRGLP